MPWSPNTDRQLQLGRIAVYGCPNSQRPIKPKAKNSQTLTNHHSSMHIEFRKMRNMMFSREPQIQKKRLWTAAASPLTQTQRRRRHKDATRRVRVLLHRSILECHILAVRAVGRPRQMSGKWLSQVLDALLSGGRQARTGGFSPKEDVRKADENEPLIRARSWAANELYPGVPLRTCMHHGCLPARGAGNEITSSERRAARQSEWLHDTPGKADVRSSETESTPPQTRSVRDHGVLSHPMATVTSKAVNPRRWYNPGASSIVARRSYSRRFK
ncbi:hypothetical protein K438DRAFT_673196 [Mycena galopus ATCC 62051]|nr:hypothetical protein K438DRAFT_673196 [Mycena galopus ATCC 62051]